MFNQKVNHYTSENPNYLNYSLGAPYVKPQDIHNCGTTVLKYNKKKGCDSLPLQTWCSPNVAVESFAMRPIVNSKDYFDIIKNYLGTIVYNDATDLKVSGMKTEKYITMNAFAIEPNNSFVQALEINVTNYLSYLMSASTDKIAMFNTYNPICEGLIINDIDIQTYQSTTNDLHFLHSVILGVVNTTRYNTISIKAEIYQDATPMINSWNSQIKKVSESQDVSLNPTSDPSYMYVSMIDLLNNTTCVLGQESECEFKGHSLSNLNSSKTPYSNLINQNNYADIKDMSWLSYDGLGDSTYNEQGNYDENGTLKIVDTGPENFDSLLNYFK